MVGALYANTNKERVMRHEGGRDGMSMAVLLNQAARSDGMNPGKRTPAALIVLVSVENAFDPSSPALESLNKNELSDEIEGVVIFPQKNDTLV